MMDRIGVMQGRFTPKGGFLPQQFPWENWKDEFYLAGVNNVPFIEWMFNDEQHENNPVWTHEGRLEIKEIVANTGVKVSSICMNYYMENGIFRYGKKSLDILARIAMAAQELDATVLVIPLFGESNVHEEEHMRKLMTEFACVVAGSDIKLAFETNWNAEAIKRCIESIDNDKVGVCYDVGNLCGEGHDVIAELHSLHSIVKEVHIKDKKMVDGDSVMLGHGSVPFWEVFRLMVDMPVRFVLESYFGNDAIKDTLCNINYIRRVMDEQ